MTLSSVSLNALRAFEAAARHLSFTRAASELSVTQAAISHQVKSLEERLGIVLFRRTSRGLVLTDEAVTLIPTLSDTFERLGRLLSQFDGGAVKEVLTVSVVGTFATWLIPRLPGFQVEHPFVDVRLMTGNNRVEMAGESLDLAVRFGGGAWHGVDAVRIMEAPLAPMCSPRPARGLETPRDLARLTLLRSYRLQDWPGWFAAAGVEDLVARGPMFDSSWVMVETAMRTDAVALVPPRMFDGELASGRLVQPFDLTVDMGAYWLTRLATRRPTAAMEAFSAWLTREAGSKGAFR